MIAWFWSVATYLTLGACVLIIFGCAVSLVASILGWDREDVVDQTDWQAVQDERERARLTRAMGKR